MAGIVQRTVFISYRRIAPFHARAVYQHLNANGYDVFMDVERMDSGAFDEILLRQIAARAHFVLLLTPSALDRCANPADWLRREIEHAIDMRRNIVPVTFEGFSWEAASPFMIEKLSVLGKYNALNVPTDYFDEAMTRLRTRHLNIDVDAVIHPTPAADKPIVAERKAEAESAPTVTAKELTAEQYGAKAHEYNATGHFDEAVAMANHALRLKPNYAYAFIERGFAYNEKSEYDRAITDLSEAIRLDPDDGDAYLFRGIAYDNQSNFRRAIADYSDAIRLGPSSYFEYILRAEAYRQLGLFTEAEDDERVAERLRNITANSTPPFYGTKKY